MPSESIHIIPRGDLKEHSIHAACWCEPRQEPQVNGNVLVVHNAADGREFYEFELPPSSVIKGH